MKCRCHKRDAVIFVYAAEADLSSTEGRKAAQQQRSYVCGDCVPIDAIRITAFAFQERIVRRTEVL